MEGSNLFKAGIYVSTKSCALYNIIAQHAQQQCMQSGWQCPPGMPPQLQRWMHCNSVSTEICNICGCEMLIAHGQTCASGKKVPS
jgi:hypothetical protein